METPSSLQQINITVSAKWKDISGQYTSARGLFIGKVLVARYFYDGTIARGDENKYRVTSPIDGIKSVLGNFKTEEECEKKCYDVAQYFLTMLNTK